MFLQLVSFNDVGACIPDNKQSYIIMQSVPCNQMIPFSIIDEAIGRRMTCAWASVDAGVNKVVFDLALGVTINTLNFTMAAHSLNKGTNQPIPSMWQAVKLTHVFTSSRVRKWGGGLMDRCNVGCQVGRIILLWFSPQRNFKVLLAIQSYFFTPQFQLYCKCTSDVD